MSLPEFITQDADGQMRLTGHRIGVQDVVFFYNEGYSPEMLCGQFPTLSLALIHKVIAFYLENREAVDAYVRAEEAEVDRLRAEAPRGPGLAELRRRLEAMHRAEVS